MLDSSIRKIHDMMLRAYFLVALLICMLVASHQQQGHATEILWDEWGVPHVYGDTEQEMFFGLGWANMKSHGNLILKMFGKSRGRGAEYWGPQLLPNDILIHRLQFPELAKTWLNQRMDNGSVISTNDQAVVIFGKC